MATQGNASEPRVFEVHGTLNLGFKPQADKKAPREFDIRTIGASVTDDELRSSGLSESEVEGLLSNGTLSDPDAPTRPSLAPIYAAHALAARVAKHVGLLRVKGAEHVFEGETYQGIGAFRDGVTVERLESAITNAWKEKGQ